jgi:hypothetical protein
MFGGYRNKRHPNDGLLRDDTKLAGAAFFRHATSPQPQETQTMAETTSEWPNAGGSAQTSHGFEPAPHPVYADAAPEPAPAPSGTKSEPRAGVDPRDAKALWAALQRLLDEEQPDGSCWGLVYVHETDAPAMSGSDLRLMKGRPLTTIVWEDPL